MKESGSNAHRKGEESPFVAQEAPAVRIEDDYHGWLLDQASVLRHHRHSSLDWSNLAEELEAMAAAERRELLRRLTTLLAHLLKFQYQPEVRRERSRKLTIVRSRTEIKRLLDYSPGLKGQLTEYVAGLPMLTPRTMPVWTYALSAISGNSYSQSPVPGRSNKYRVLTISRLRIPAKSPD